MALVLYQKTWLIIFFFMIEKEGFIEYNYV